MINIIIRNIFSSQINKKKDSASLRILCLCLAILAGFQTNIFALTEGDWFLITGNPYVYFDNTNTNWDKVSLMLGRQWNYGSDAIGSYGQNMSQIANTKLWVVKSNNEAHMTTLAFFGVKDWGWEENNILSNRCNYTDGKYTNSFNKALPGSSDHIYLYTPANSAANTDLSRTIYPFYNDLNRPQTVKVYVKTAGSSSYTEAASWLGTITANRYRLNSATVTNNTNAALSSGSPTFTSVITSSAKVTESNTTAGYTFKGWGTTTSGPTTASTSYTYTVSDATTVYAFFDENTYSITYKDEGDVTFTGTGWAGEGSHPATYGVSTATITLDTPTKDYYTFVGWYTTSACTGAPIVQIAQGSTGNKTLYAKWTDTKYNIRVQHYYYAQKNPVGKASGEINEGDYVNTYDLINNAIGKETAWNYTSNAQKLGFVHSRWFVRYGKVIFNSNEIDGTGSLVEISTTIRTSNSISLAGGYKTTNQAFIQIYDRWAERKRTFTVNASAGGTASNVSAVKACGIYTSDTITAIPSTGYHFSGWTSSPNANYTFIFSDASMETTQVRISSDESAQASGSITANFAANETSVTFAKNDGSGDSFVEGVAYNSRSKITCDAVSDTLRAGYKFNHYWDASSNGNRMTKINEYGNIYFVASAREGYLDGSGNWIKDGGTATFYAHWTPKQCTLYFDANGGSDAPSSRVVTYDANTNMISAVAKPTAPTNKVFAGYYTDNVNYNTQIVNASGDFLSNVTNYITDGNWTYDHDGQITLYAKWDDVAQVTVVWGVTYSNAAVEEDVRGTLTATSGGSPVVSGDQFYVGQVINFSYEPVKGHPGYFDQDNAFKIFDFYDGVDTNNSNSLGHTGNTLAYTVTGSEGQTKYVYANPRYVKYSFTMANNPIDGGYITIDKQDEGDDEDEGKAGPDVRRKLKAFANTGYTFTNWSFSSGEHILLATDAEGYEGITMTSSPIKVYVNADDQVVTANYTPITYTITYANMDGATNWVGAPANYNIETATIALGTPTKTGYTFAGWKVTNAEGDAITEITQGSTGNKTLWATWTAKTTSVTFNKNGGANTAQFEKALTYGTREQIMAAADVTTDIVREGYTFNNYWTTADGGLRMTNVSGNGNLWMLQGAREGYLDANGKWIKDGGTATFYAHWTENLYTITLNNATVASVEAGIDTHPTITAAAAPTGRSFSHWTATGGVTVANTTNATTTVSATAAGTVTAYYTDLPTIFFKNTVGWSSVYVTLDSYWDTYNNPSKGAGSKDKTYIEMTRIGETDIYYADITGAADFTKIAFNEGNQANYANFYNTKAAYRSDWSSCKPLFIPSTASSGTNNGTTYYSDGDWTTYGTTTNMYIVGLDGNWERIEENRFTKANSEATIFTIELELEQGNHEFKLHSCSDNWYSNTGTMTRSNCSGWTMSSGGTNCTITADVKGTYIFTYDYPNKKLSVTYPEAYKVSFECNNSNYGSVSPTSFYVLPNSVISSVNNTITIDGKTATATPHAAENYWTFTFDKWNIPDNVTEITDNITIQADITPQWGGGDVLSLDVTGTLKVGQTVTAVVTNQGLFPPYTYIYEVLEPGATGYKTFYNDSGTSKTYGISGGGTYTFRVSATIEGNNYQAEKQIVVGGSTLYLKHTFDGEWSVVVMTDNGDGTFTYYNDGTGEGTASAFFTYCGANVGTDLENLAYFNPIGGDGKKIIDARSGEMSDGDPVIWTYNSLTDELTISNPADKKYRLAITKNTKTYYSNAVAAGSAQNISFYCTTDATVKLQSYSNGVWSVGSEIDRPTAVTENGVYSGTINISEPASVTFPTLAKYTGDYTVTTKALNTSVTMTSFTPGPSNYYDHYFVEWIESGNIFAMVGNSINNNLANAIGDYTLPSGANVRFAYNPATNVFTRTHLAGSSSEEKYVAVFGTNVQDTINGKHASLIAPDNAAKFIDCSDWVYSVGIRSNGNGVESSIKLVAQYNGTYTYLLTPDGSDAEGAKKVLCTSGNKLGDNPLFNIIYDYKTNEIISGWCPAGKTVEETIEVSELINTRTDDEPTSEFTIPSGKVIATNRMITQFVITKKMFDSWNGNTVGGYKTMFFWFSVPYSFTAGSIYGFKGSYGISNTGAGPSTTSWEIQSYRGEMRDAGTAGSSPWKRPKVGVTLDANAGYVLAVRLRAEDFKSIIIDKDLPSEHTISEVRFFIPSSGSVTLNPTATETLEEYTTNPAWYNQDWHVMNVPVMASGCKMVEQDKETAPFESVYQWTWANGERWYDPVAVEETTFKAGHAYMVQGHGILTWSYPADPKPLMARKNTVSRTNTKFRIDLIQNDELQDKTYVLYRADGTRAYEIGRDLEKITNEGRSMIYSEHDIRLASICLADTDNMQIPLTVVATESGEYTLRIPTQVEGIEPVLYDALTNQETLLNYGELTLTLSAGTYRDRFYLGVRNKQATPTTIEDVYGNKDQVFKYIDNSGNLMILRNGHTYDAVGHLIR